MPTHAERQAMIDKIKNLPAALEAAVNGLNDTQLDTPYRSGGWTVRQVVHHLADSHMNAFARLKWILTEDRTTLKAYNQDAWAALPDSKLPLQSSLSIIRGVHERWVALLRSVPESGWSKPAIHPESGEYTLDKLLSIYSNHGEKHIGHIMGLRKTKGW